MEDKITWMTEQSSRLDGMNLCEDEILVILATGGGVGVFSDAEVDYVHELEEEWDQAQ